MFSSLRVQKEVTFFLCLSYRHIHSLAEFDSVEFFSCFPTEKVKSAQRKRAIMYFLADVFAGCATLTTEIYHIPIILLTEWVTGYLLNYRVLIRKNRLTVISHLHRK